MKGHYFRWQDGDFYLIPSEMIDEFDSLTEEIEDFKEGSDDWYDLTGKFNDKFRDFKMEGDLYDTELFLD